MMPQERLGRRLFIILATLLILQQLGTVGRDFFGGSAEVNWTRLVLAPSVETALSVLPGLFRHWVVQLTFLVSTLFLWSGHTWLRMLVGSAYMLVGATMILAGVAQLFAIGIVGAESILSGVAGSVHVFAGAAILFLPSLHAFFRFQRERRLVRREDVIFIAPPTRGFKHQLTAVAWGFALGFAGVFLTSAYSAYAFAAHFVFGELIRGVLHEVGVGLGELMGHRLGSEVFGLVLAAASMGGLVGLVAGLAVGIAQPRAKQSALRLMFTRGLVASATCVAAMVLASAAAAMWGLPGWAFRTDWKSTGLLQGSLQVAVMGFVLGSGIALLINDADV